jgi:hypothetical protein
VGHTPNDRSINRPLDYDDGLIATTDDALVIRRYNAFLQPKSLPYSDIRSVGRIAMNRLRHWRLWGTTIPGYWFNFDVNRRHKSTGFVIDAGRPIKPIITPDDPDRLLVALRSHNVAVAAHP